MAGENGETPLPVPHPTVNPASDSMVIREVENMIACFNNTP